MITISKVESSSQSQIKSRKARFAAFWKRYASQKKGVVGLAILGFFAAIALLAPIIAPYNPFKISGVPLLGPSWSHLLGTNDIGGDIFSELLYGARISLYVGLVASLGANVIGTAIGLVAGYVGGITDEAIMRVTDIFLTLPFVVLAIIFAAYLGPGINNIVLILTVLGWTGTARVIRSQVLSARELPYVEASRSIGSSRLKILYEDVFPNVLPLTLVYIPLSAVYYVLAETGLSFLGLGDPNQKSWGSMLAFAQQAGAYVSGEWWWILAPGLCVTAVGVGFFFVGDALNKVIGTR